MYKDDLLEGVVKSSAKPFNFQIAYKLSDEKVRVSKCMQYQNHFRVFITVIAWYETEAKKEIGCPWLLLLSKSPLAHFRKLKKSVHKNLIPYK